jgi:type I restriction enzyme R subunit
VLDFVNDPQEVLNAFKSYYTTAALSDTTDPNIIFDLRSKLDALGYYDEHEIDRVVNVTLNPKSKSSH